MLFLKIVERIIGIRRSFSNPSLNLSLRYRCVCVSLYPSVVMKSLSPGNIFRFLHHHPVFPCLWFIPSKPTLTPMIQCFRLSLLASTTGCCVQRLHSLANTILIDDMIILTKNVDHTQLFEIIFFNLFLTFSVLKLLCNLFVSSCTNF